VTYVIYGTCALLSSQCCMREQGSGARFRLSHQFRLELGWNDYSPRISNLHLPKTEASNTSRIGGSADRRSSIFFDHRCQLAGNLRHAGRMDAHQDNTQPAAVTTLLGHIAAALPASLRPQVELAAPMLSVSAARLGLEVLDAERRAIRFSTAVERNAEYPLMGRV
jgi:hypothetical protein